LKSTNEIRFLVESFLRQHIQFNQRILVAFSGGLDSSVLLDLLLQCRTRINFRLQAIHFHHGLSPNADTWTEHCSRVCATSGVRFDVTRLTVPIKSEQGIECSARHARYSALQAIDTDWVVLGHHANDQAETVFLNLLRGSGVLGLAGMAPVQGRYLRPLLFVRRSELEAYAAERELSWCEDESNLDQKYTRNYVRHDVLNGLRGRFPSIDLNIARTAAHAATANRLLTELAINDAGNSELVFPFAIGAFKHLSPDRAVNLFRVLLTGTGRQCPSTVRVHEFIRQLRDAAPDRHPEIRIGAEKVFVRKKQLQIERLFHD
jgi:tRNA(Ile)-lysidine synthase